MPGGRKRKYGTTIEDSFGNGSSSTRLVRKYQSPATTLTVTALDKSDIYTRKVICRRNSDTALTVLAKPPEKRLTELDYAVMLYDNPNDDRLSSKCCFHEKYVSHAVGNCDKVKKIHRRVLPIRDRCSDCAQYGNSSHATHRRNNCNRNQNNRSRPYTHKQSDHDRTGVPEQRKLRRFEPLPWPIPYW